MKSFFAILMISLNFIKIFQLTGKNCSFSHSVHMERERAKVVTSTATHTSTAHTQTDSKREQKLFGSCEMVWGSASLCTSPYNIQMVRTRRIAAAAVVVFVSSLVQKHKMSKVSHVVAVAAVVVVAF